MFVSHFLLRLPRQLDDGREPSRHIRFDNTCIVIRRIVIDQGAWCLVPLLGKTLLAVGPNSRFAEVLWGEANAFRQSELRGQHVEIVHENGVLAIKGRAGAMERAVVFPFSSAPSLIRRRPIESTCPHFSRGSVVSCVDCRRRRRRGLLLYRDSFHEGCCAVGLLRGRGRGQA